MIRHFYYYAYYRLYNWSKAVDPPKIAILRVIAWMLITSMFHVATVLSIITLCFGVDPGAFFFSLPVGPELIFGLSGWALIIWLILKGFHVHEKAFSREALNEYKTLGFNTWWLATYFLISALLMAWVTWKAGEHIRSHQAGYFIR